MKKADDENCLIELGLRIRARRRKLNISQEELSGLAGLDRSYIGGVERGERNLSFKNLVKISKGLKCDLAILTKGITNG